MARLNQRAGRKSGAMKRQPLQVNGVGWGQEGQSIRFPYSIDLKSIEMPYEARETIG